MVKGTPISYEVKEEIAQAIEDGLNISELMDQYDIGRSRCYSLAKERGLSITPKPKTKGQKAGQGLMEPQVKAEQELWKQINEEVANLSLEHMEGIVKLGKIIHARFDGLAQQMDLPLPDFAVQMIEWAIENGGAVEDLVEDNKKLKRNLAETNRLLDRRLYRQKIFEQMVMLNLVTDLRVSGKDFMIYCQVMDEFFELPPPPPSTDDLPQAPPDPEIERDVDLEEENKDLKRRLDRKLYRLKCFEQMLMLNFVTDVEKRMSFEDMQCYLQVWDEFYDYSPPTPPSQPQGIDQEALKRALEKAHRRNSK